MTTLNFPLSRRAVLAASLPALLAAHPALAEKAPVPKVTIEELMAPNALPDIVQGKADAPATIVEYASMACSHCAAFHRGVWPALKAKYVDAGKAKFVLREFPLDPVATAAFMLARCAGPEKRDAIVDRLFDHQADWAFAANPLSKLKDQMTASGMAEADFETCLKNQKLLDAVKAERETAATKLGVNSTPTFFVAGKRLGSEHSLEKFDEILEPTAK